MKREDIIRMAREAGAMFDHMTWVERDLAPVFERFASLVAAVEREACAKLCEELRFSELGPSPAAKHQRDLCAAAIRARGQQ